MPTRTPAPLRGDGHAGGRHGHILACHHACARGSHADSHSRTAQALPLSALSALSSGGALALDFRHQVYPPSRQCEPWISEPISTQVSRNQYQWASD